MPSIQVKEVPDDVHAVLRTRAAASGQSLQEYLLTRLIEDARAPTLEEVLVRVEHRTSGRVGLKAAARAVRSERGSVLPATRRRSE